MLRIPKPAFEQLRRHGEDAWPHECCGILVGAVSASVKSVLRAMPVNNATRSDPHRSYQIAPLDLIRIERQARSERLEILGFYHSHPDHPAHPSASDLAEAHWLGCSYVITEIRQARAALTRSFHLAGSSEEGKHFEDEVIETIETTETMETIE
jgi:proteasome lid subunit RPN8/RPN11